MSTNSHRHASAVHTRQYIIVVQDIGIITTYHNLGAELVINIYPYQTNSTVSAFTILDIGFCVLFVAVAHSSFSIILLYPVL